MITPINHMVLRKAKSRNFNVGKIFLSLIVVRLLRLLVFSSGFLSFLYSLDASAAVDGYYCEQYLVSDYFYVKIDDNTYKINVDKLKKEHPGRGFPSFSNSFDKIRTPGDVNFDISNIAQRRKYGCPNKPFPITPYDFFILNSNYVDIYLNGKAYEVKMNVSYRNNRIIYNKVILILNMDGYCKLLNASEVIHEPGINGCMKSEEGKGYRSGYFHADFDDESKNVNIRCIPVIKAGSECTVSYPVGKYLTMSYVFNFDKAILLNILKFNSEVRELIYIEPEAERLND